MDMYTRLNSKRFLLLYLVVIACLLSVWVFKLVGKPSETRSIPDTLSPFLTTPPAPLPQFLLYSDAKSVFTDQSLIGKWTFVYFTHPDCMPSCDPVFMVLKNLKHLFAGQSVEFALMNFDVNHTDISNLATVSELPVYRGDGRMMAELEAAFGFYALRTDYQNDYSLEQTHAIFLIDPQGRYYARFEPPFTSYGIQAVFLAIRSFYARTE